MQMIHCMWTENVVLCSNEIMISLLWIFRLLPNKIGRLSLFLVHWFCQIRFFRMDITSQNIVPVILLQRSVVHSGVTHTSGAK